MQEIGSDDVGFGETAGNVHAVHLLVEVANPFLEIAQYLQGVVAEVVAAIVVYAVAAELVPLSANFATEAVPHQLTADTRLLICARTWGSTVLLVISGSSILGRNHGECREYGDSDM